jgi:hypothetical protein
MKWEDNPCRLALASPTKTGKAVKTIFTGIASASGTA